ncbi:MAG: serine/threonine-protein kinase [Nannocystaceae bacterium]|nr:serine/threonine-protein kinase [Nannocystaceae bacterium]
MTATVDSHERDEPLDLRERIALAAIERRLLGNTVDPPLVAGRYELHAEIGAGGMGVVRRAWDRELQRVVALKFLRVGPRPDAAFARRLVQEAQALAQLAHPNVVAVYDVGPAEDAYYVAMEYIRGADVPQWLARERRAWHEIVAVFVQAAHGLAAAHDAGLVHRDVKPSNLVLGEDGRVRVVDFGLALARRTTPAAARDDDASPPWPGAITPPGSVLGTPGYTAPEQLAGRAADAASDQFAWCVSLFEALWQRRPFEPTALHRAATGAALPRPPTPPLHDPVPRWLMPILRRGLQADPAQRWPSMRALATAIERRLARRGRAPYLLGALALATAAGALALPRASAAPLCDAELATPWPRDGGTALALAFSRSDAPFAATAADHAIARLDRWAQRWDEARATVCTAQRPSAPATLRCLEHSAAEARATAALLAEATPDVIAHATDAVASLDDPTACLRATEPPASNPLDAPSPARRNLEDAIAQAAANNRAGRSAAAADALAAIVATLQTDERAIDLRARARLQLGHALHDLSREEAAHDALADAYFEALRVDDPRTATEALTMLVLVDGERLGRSDDAARWARHAHALIAAARLGPRAEGRLLHVEAAAHVVRGRHQAAIDAAVAALEQFEAAADAEPLDEAWTLHTLANARHEAGEFAAALADHERARTMVTAVLGEGHPEALLIDSGIAGDRLALGRADEALAGYQAVLARLQRDGDAATIARAHNNLAVTYEALARPDDADAHYRSALAGYEAAGATAWPATAATLYNLGHLHYRRGLVPQAVGEFRRCLELRRALLEPDNPAIAATTTALAVALEDSGDFDAALPQHLAALESRERVDPDALAVGHALFNLGLHHDKRGQSAAAIQWLTRALEHARAHHHDAFAAEVSAELTRVRTAAPR